MQSESSTKEANHIGLKLIFFGIGAILLMMPLGKSSLFYWITETPKYLVLGMGIFTALTGMLIHSQKNPIKVSELNLPVIVLLLIGLLSTFFSINKSTSLFGLYSIGEGFVFTCFMFVLFICAQQLNTKLLRRLIIFAVIPVFPIAALAAYEGFYLNYYRSAATMTNPVYLGSYAALVLPLILYELNISTALRRKSFYVISAFFCLAALILSYSRVPMLLASILLVAYMFKGKWHKILLPAILASVLLLSVIHGSSYSSLGPQLTNRIAGLLVAENYAPRVEMAKTAMRVTADNPVTGSGPGTYSYLAMRHISKKFVDTELFTDPESIMKGEPHNVFLTMVSTVGLPGLVALIWIIVIFAYKYSRLRTVKQDDSHTGLMNAFYVIILFFVLIKLSQPNQMLDWMFFWLSAGIIAGNTADVRKIRLPALFLMPVLIPVFFITVVMSVFSDMFLSNALTDNYRDNSNNATRAYKIAPWNDYARVHAAKNAFYNAKYSHPEKFADHVQPAIKTIEAAIANNTYDVYYRLTAANIYNHMAKQNPMWLKFAETHINMAVETYPNHPVPRKMLVENLVEQNRLKEARSLLPRLTSYRETIDGIDDLLKRIGD